VPALDVQGASTSLTTTSTIDAQFDYGVELHNPNRHVTMEYTNLNVATLYLGTDIGHSGVHLGGLRVGHRSSYTAPITTSAMSLQVNNIVGDALQRKRQQLRNQARASSRSPARTSCSRQHAHKILVSATSFVALPRSMVNPLNQCAHLTKP
jgi:hypothetical protein